MTFFLSAFIFPLLSVLILSGIGCLVAEASGRRLRPELIIPAGLGGLVVFSQFMAWLGIGKPVNVILMFVLAAVGLAFAIRGGSRFWPHPVTARDFTLPALAGGAACLLLLATIILNGAPSMAGYLSDTTSYVQMRGGAFALGGTTDFGSIGVATSDTSIIGAYYGSASYPYGSQIILAILGAGAGVNLLWVYTPFMALMLGITALGLFRIARTLEIDARLAALVAFLAATPAIVYSFALQGSIKEIVFLPCLILASCLLLDRELRSNTRALAVVGAVAYVAMIGAIGLGAMGWILPLALATLIATWTKLGGDRSPKQMFVAAGVLAGATLLAMLPKLGGLIDDIRLAMNLSQTNTNLAADPGNLYGPIGKKQGFGTWLGPQHRFPAEFPDMTTLLIGVTIVLLIFGVIALLRERRFAALTWLAMMVVIWFGLTVRGTMWLDAKLVMITSPVLVLFALFGASRLRLPGKAPDDVGSRSAWMIRRSPAILGVSAITVGVLGSAALLFFATAMLPSERYQEVAKIGEEYAGEGPAFTPEFDENAFYELREIGVTGPGYAYTPQKYVLNREGVTAGYGGAIDIDQSQNRVYSEFPLVISRRSPSRSRPGADFSLASSGDFYDVWRRDTGIEVVEHLPVGERFAVGEPKCADVRKLAGRAREDDSLKLLAALPVAETVAIERNDLEFQGKLAARASDGTIIRSGTISTSADVEPEQALWWIGNVTRPLEVSANGSTVGELRNGLGGNGNVVGPVDLPSGSVDIMLERGGANLVPGTRHPGTLEALVLAPSVPAEVVEIDPNAAADKLCGRQVDWIELAKD